MWRSATCSLPDLHRVPAGLQPSQRAPVGSSRKATLPSQMSPLLGLSGRCSPCAHAQQAPIVASAAAAAGVRLPSPTRMVTRTMLRCAPAALQHRCQLTLIPHAYRAPTATASCQTTSAPWCRAQTMLGGRCARWASLAACAGNGGVGSKPHCPREHGPLPADCSAPTHEASQNTQQP